MSEPAIRREPPATGAGSSHATAAENARFAAFAESLEKEGFSHATRACYASDWWNVAAESRRSTGRRFRIDRFGPDDFRLQRAHLSALGTAPATLNRRLAFLRRYTAFCAAREPSLRETAEGFAEVPFQPVLRRPTRALTHAQEEKLRTAADALGPVESAVVALLFGTGLRAAEAADLARADVEGPPDAPVSLRVRGPRSKTVVLPPRARERLAAILAGTGGRADDAVFRGRGDRPLGEDGVTAIVERAAREADVEATPRTLRHTFAVRYLSEHRGDVEGLARALGQTSLAAARAYRSEANAGTPAVRAFRWAATEETAPAAGVRRRVVSGARIESERALLAPGTRIPSHAHPEEQMSFVLSGAVTFEVEGAQVAASAGDLVHVPPGVAHAVVVSKERPALLLHVYSPPRRSRDGPGG